MDIAFKKISDFERGTLFLLLKDSYSFDHRWQEHFEQEWIGFDNFFFDNLEIADRCGFITVFNGEPIGHISWDPRNIPQYVIMGHNCIASGYKGYGYGKLQLQEAVCRILKCDVKKL